jgi:hypothetical protein
MKKVLDDPSGSSAASRPAADLAPAEQPGARRPANPGALPVDAAPEGLRGLGRAPRLADDAPAGPSSSGRQVRPRTTPATADIPEQPSAFQRRLLAQQPPGAQAERLHDGLHLLAGRIGALPEAARQQAFTQVLPRAAQLETDLLEDRAKTLVGQLQVLPEAARRPAFSILLQQCSLLASEQRAVMLKALTHEIGSLSEPVWLPAVRGVLAAAESLAPEQRWAVLKPLGQEVYRLPVAEQSSTWRAVVRSVLAVPPGQLAAALAAMADQINTLNDGVQLPAVPLMPAVLQESLAWLQRGEDLPPAPLTTMLLMLASRWADLPPADQQVGFELALHSIPLLRQDDHRSLLLMEWAKAIEVLPEAARQPAWQATLQAVEQLPPPQRVVPLASLVAQMGGLPVDARAPAFESVWQAQRTLPAQVPYQELSVTMLGSGCLALPRAQWPHALDRVLVELARIPEPLRRVNVLALATKFCQAEPAANGSIDPGQLDNPGLDLRLQCLDKVLGLMPPPPHPLAGFLEFLNTQMTQRLLQRPDDAAFLTEVLKRIHWLRGA